MDRADLFSPHDPKRSSRVADPLGSHDDGETWERSARPDAQRQVEAGRVGRPHHARRHRRGVYGMIFTLAIARGTGPSGRVRRRPGVRHARRRQDPAGRDAEGHAGVDPDHSIEASPHDNGTAYVAARCTSATTSARTSTRPPTTGRPGPRSSTAFPMAPYARRARRPRRQGLLFAGTETGLYVSFDDGAQWQPFQRNLPACRSPTSPSRTTTWWSPRTAARSGFSTT